MRCAIDFDEEKPLIEQEVKAWGEYQSMSDAPSYKESEIKKPENKSAFFGYKMALDDICLILDNLELDEEITPKQNEEIQCRMSGSLCELLYTILDGEFIDSEKESE